MAEEKLIWSILFRAVRDALGAPKITNEGRFIETNAQDWILCTWTDTDTPFTFGWLCDQVGLSARRLADVVRRKAGPGFVPYRYYEQEGEENKYVDIPCARSKFRQYGYRWEN